VYAAVESRREAAREAHGIIRSAHDCLVNKNFFRAFAREAIKPDEIRISRARKIFLVKSPAPNKSCQARETRPKIDPPAAVYPPKIFFTGWRRPARFKAPNRSHSLESGSGDSPARGRAYLADGVHARIFAGENRARCASARKPAFASRQRIKERYGVA